MHSQGSQTEIKPFDGQYPCPFLLQKGSKNTSWAHGSPSACVHPHARARIHTENPHLCGKARHRDCLARVRTQGTQDHSAAATTRTNPDSACSNAGGWGGGGVRLVVEAPALLSVVSSMPIHTRIKGSTPSEQPSLNITRALAAW